MGCKLLRELPHTPRGDARWQYECLYCGKHVECFEFTFWQRKSEGCGCQSSRFGNKRLVALVGTRIGYIEFLERVSAPRGSSARYLCRCHRCNRTYETFGTTVRHSKSAEPCCGCDRDEIMRINTQSPKKLEGIQRHFRSYRVARGLSPDHAISPDHEAERASIKLYLNPAILRRDNYSCIFCGTNQKLNVHHIRNFSDNPTLRQDPSNLITMCRECHVDIAHMGNTTRYREGDPGLFAFLFWTSNRRNSVMEEAC